MISMDAVRSILIDLGIPEHVITADARLVSDLELDSTETIEVSLALNRKFGVAVRLDSRADPTLAAICQLTEDALATTRK